MAVPGLRTSLGLVERGRKEAFCPYGGGVRRLCHLHRCQIGRVLDYLDESGQLENTIIVVVSDNGASAEGGPSGSFNENKFLNNIPPDTVEANLPHIDELGGPGAYNHYCTGWAWAFDTPPFPPYWKRFAGYEGGTADMCLIAWPRGISARGEVRHQYVHAVDIVPTLYDLLGIEPPKVLKGYTRADRGGGEHQGRL